jgi:hypothetical protein
MSCDLFEEFEYVKLYVLEGMILPTTVNIELEA